MKKILLATVCLMLALVLTVPVMGQAGEPKTFKEEAITFCAYTPGAEAAFDGDRSTGYAGSITAELEKRSVLTGVTIRADAPLRELTVKGSENGVDWVELYYQKTVSSIAIFGSNGSGSISDTTCDDMYTYSLKYLRVEITYGSISEIAAFGYSMGVEGYIAPLDTSFDGDGYQTSGSYYEDYERMPFVVDHCVHSSSKGEVVSYQFLDDAKTQKFAYLTLKAKGSAPITEIALMHKDDKNVTRWDGIRVDVSEDGKNWTNVTTFPADFSTKNNLRQRTLMLVDVPEGGSFVYARVSSTKASISICVMDLYVKAEPVSVPESILSGWENDPFIERNAPEEPKETQKPAETTTAVTSASADETTAATESGGCGASVASAVLPMGAAYALGALIHRKKRRK